jgi:hypothetical protein
MWDKLFGLFKDTEAEELKSPVPQVQQVQQAPPSTMKPDGKSVHIGYNYLKGLDGENEDTSKQLRKFINLNKLLRGRYDGKIATTDEDSIGNIRSEDDK